MSLEVADVIRVHGEAYRARFNPTARELAIMTHIEQCRTATLGGHADVCDDCGHALKISYNSCRDRHCPKCQGEKRRRWVESRVARLLPVPHFHAVFTIPDKLNPVTLRNKKVVCNILFRATAETLSTIARDPKHFGAEIGFTAALHTWGQNLAFHPHLHCVVTGGGLSLDGQRWLEARREFLLPIGVLRDLFKKKFMAYLKEACRSGQIKGNFSFDACKSYLYGEKWHVFVKRSFGCAEAVMRYLGRYTHRVAISNSRLLSMEDGKVTFKWKDRRDGDRTKLMTLTASEFIRRFLLHVLPRGYTRIRHFGLFAPVNTNTKLEQCRALVADTGAEDQPEVPDQERTQPEQEPVLETCPACGCKRIHRVPLEPGRILRWDTS